MSPRGRCALIQFGLNLALLDVNDAHITQHVASFGCFVPFRGDLRVVVRQSLQKRGRVCVLQRFRNERGGADVRVSIWQEVEEAGYHAR